MDTEVYWLMERQANKAGLVGTALTAVAWYVAWYVGSSGLVHVDGDLIGCDVSRHWLCREITSLFMAGWT